MTPLHERLGSARQALTRAGIDAETASFDAEVLARHVLGWDRAALIARARDPLPPGFQARFDAVVARRAAREPVAYIIGRREFWGLDLEVTPDVLIPRPETEILVEEALSCAGDDRRLIADVGTGSGCIAVALAHSLQTARIVATDRSAAALDVARRNAVRHSVDKRIVFLQADLLGGVPRDADLIVSNPPYVAASDASTLQPEVARFEPSAALFGGGADGLDVLRRLVSVAGHHLAREGRLIVEFGFGQDEELRRLAAEAGWEMVRMRNDLQGIPRVAVLRR